MPDVYNLYNKYIRINGRWEKLNDTGGATSSDVVLKFKESITANQLTNLNIDTTTISDVYNIIDGFTTDSRFIEGAGLVKEPGTCIAVIERNGTKYFNIIGRTFNVDYILGEIARLQLEIDALNLDWDHIVDKPFSSVGAGLDVTNDTLNATPLLQELATLQEAINRIRVDWDHLDNKPFNTIGTDFIVENGELKILSLDWSKITNKPFNTLSNKFIVNDGELDLNISLAWNDVTDKPFDTIDTSDFYVRTVSGKKRLEISSSFYHYEINSSGMSEIRTILNS